MKKILSVVLVMILMLSFVGCGNGRIAENSEVFVGTYKLLNNSMDFIHVLVINKDKTAVYIAGGGSEKYTWTKDEDSSTLYFINEDDRSIFAADFVDGGFMRREGTYSTKTYNEMPSTFFEKID